MTIKQTEIADREDVGFETGSANWESKSYRCHPAVLADEDGGFSALVLNLPGAGSCGDSEDEAIANAREAVVGVIESYLDEKAEIPWLDAAEYQIPEGATQKWIVVNV